MYCSKVLKDAVDGIDFRYKMDDIINELPEKQKFNSKQLEGFLIKKGVSPKEIQANSLFTQVGDKEVYTASEWQVLNEVRGKQRFTERDLGTQYEDVTLNRSGIENESYKETGDVIQQRLQDNVPVPHYNDNLKLVENDPFSSEYLVGHRRVHLDEINGKPSTVLNELQSDWAQSERAGRGVFRSSSDKKKLEFDNLVKTKYAREKEINAGSPENYPGELEELGTWLFDNVESEFSAAGDIIADFPISSAKYQQYQIVKTINEAIKNGTNRVVIPIERSNELMGTKGVTKFYNSLGKKILPDIRKKLEKQGLKIKLSKEKIIRSKEYTPEKFKNQLANIIDSADADSSYNILESMKEFENSGFQLKTMEDFEKWAKEEAYTSFFNELAVKYKGNPVHTIDIEKLPGKQVRWDIYSILSSLGLTEFDKESKTK